MYFPVLVADTASLCFLPLSSVRNLVRRLLVVLLPGIFIGPQIRELMQDKQFDEDLNETERNAWL